MKEVQSIIQVATREGDIAKGRRSIETYANPFIKYKVTMCPHNLLSSLSLCTMLGIYTCRVKDDRSEAVGSRRRRTGVLDVGDMEYSQLLCPGES